MQYKIKREMAETGRNWNGDAKIMKKKILYKERKI